MSKPTETQLRWTASIRAAAIAVGLVWAACAPAPAPTDPAYVREIEQWRAEREERLRSETGWLTLVGLHWLEAGDNRFGSDPANEVALPEGTAPPVAGSFLVEGDRVTVRAGAAAGLSLGGDPVTRRELKADDTGEPDVLRLNDLSLYVIKREDRYAVRVKDPNSPVRKNFTGLEYFPLDPDYRVDAVFVAYDVPREVTVPTVAGTVTTMLAPGYVEFTLKGRTLSLEPLVDTPEDEELFFIFKDETSGRETYGAGRYLYTDAPREGLVTLDFNRAYNPPCVFTPYATCPMALKRNRLPERIEAGEKVYGEQ